MRIITIDSVDDERVAAYTNLTEAQLRNRLEPEKGIFIAESPKVIDRALAAGREPVSLLVEEPWLTGMADMFERIDKRWGDDIPVYVASPEQLKKLTGYRLHRGALAAMRRWKLPTVRDLCKDARRIAVMENIVDHTNVGALMRSAAALDVDAVLVTPSCGDPLYRRAARVSMGTVFQVPWTRIDAETLDSNTENNAGHNSETTQDPAETTNPDLRNRHTKEEDRKYWPIRGLKELNDLGFTTVAMALTDDSISLDELTRRLNNGETETDHIDKLALVFGTEGDGLSHRTIANTNLTVKIPMSNGVDSLNVAASSAVAFYATSPKRN
ncbi:RNA methyltransferase [Bifidobacterium sp. ESL0690]|uniref:TrmH family RNA methyltransferase n=1 Tax=Bifidobacterium sp. ESL0690 TaxID=2983214 RepID=UPI0023F757DC|nr:RNA methyltransferase [Bifidobacterium sp. ESL0690]WEV47510.1 RNA methyltransferase [Bifidobacterium sp. ESL0690]